MAYQKKLQRSIQFCHTTIIMILTMLVLEFKQITFNCTLIYHLLWLIFHTLFHSNIEWYPAKILKNKRLLKFDKIFVLQTAFEASFECSCDFAINSGYSVTCLKLSVIFTRNCPVFEGEVIRCFNHFNLQGLYFYLFLFPTALFFHTDMLRCAYVSRWKEAGWCESKVMTISTTSYWNIY